MITTLLVTATVVVGVPAIVVWYQSASVIYTVQTAPTMDVALVLGTATDGSQPASYMKGRLNVAAALYKAGKASVILVSGSLTLDDAQPNDMMQTLVAAGVPATQIVRDFGGDDTYTSCMRARDMFGVRSVVVITQGFHLPRAVATCRLLNMQVVGVADNTPAHDWWWRGNQARELWNKATLMLDLLTHRKVGITERSDAVQRALHNR